MFVLLIMHFVDLETRMIALWNCRFGATLRLGWMNKSLRTPHRPSRSSGSGRDVREAHRADAFELHLLTEYLVVGAAIANSLDTSASVGGGAWSDGAAAGPAAVSTLMSYIFSPSAPSRRSWACLRSVLEIGSYQMRNAHRMLRCFPASTLKRPSTRSVRGSRLINCRDPPRMSNGLRAQSAGAASF
jgi:hypothetical protein